MYMGNLKFWDDKFEGRKGNIMAPEGALEENRNILKKGTVLDVACGDGRNALYLSKLGFKVTGIDFSSAALERVKNFALESDTNVDLIQRDLASEDPFEGTPKYDNVVINHYRLGKKQLNSIKDHINKGGVLFVNGFGPRHETDDKIGKEDLIYPEDFEDIEKELDLIKCTDYEDERGSFINYIFVKKR